MRLNEKITRVKNLMNIKEQFDEPQTNIKDVFHTVPLPNTQSIANLKLPENFKTSTFNFMDLCDAYQWDKVGNGQCPDKEFLPYMTNALRYFVTPDGERYSLWLTKKNDGKWIYSWYYNSKGEPWPVGGYIPSVADDEESKRKLSLQKNYSIHPPRHHNKSEQESYYFLPDTKTKIYIQVESNTSSPIKVEQIYLGGTPKKYVSNIKLPPNRINRGESEFIEFDYKPENDTDSPWDTRLEMVVVIRIYGKNKSELSEQKIIFEHSVGSKSQVLNACSRKFSQTKYGEAKGWWRDWLNNPITKSKFQNNWNYTKEKTDEIFKDYLEALDTATLIYTFDEMPNQGWVPGRGSILQWIGITTDGIDYPVYVNCNKNYYDSYIFFVHELQHILNARHEIHPYEDNIFQGQSDSLKKEFKGELSQRSEAAKRTLIDNGFNELDTLGIVINYEFMLNKDVEHLEKSNEILSSLSEVRVSLNLKPGQNLTKQDLIDNAKNDEVIIFICQWLYSGEPLQTWLNIMNASAMKKLNPKGTEMV